MSMSCQYHLNNEKYPRIVCETQFVHPRPGYPVLIMGSAALFPSVAQLRKIYHVIGDYLASEHPVTVSEPDEVTVCSQ